MVLTWPVYLTLAGFAPLLLSVYGPDFVAGQTAMVILSAAMLLSTAFGPVTVVLLMGGKSSLNLLNTVVALSAMVALTYLLTGVFGMGIEGAAFASVVSFGLVGVLVRLVLGASVAGFAVYAVIAGPLYLAFLWRYREPLELTSLKGALKGKMGRRKPPAPQAAA
jgi:O-antigen/teichoic acid export membrane protein